VCGRASDCELAGARDSIAAPAYMQSTAIARSKPFRCRLDGSTMKWWTERTPYPHSRAIRSHNEQRVQLPLWRRRSVLTCRGHGFECAVMTPIDNPHIGVSISSARRQRWIQADHDECALVVDRETLRYEFCGYQGRSNVPFCNKWVFMIKQRSGFLRHFSKCCFAFKIGVYCRTCGP